MTQYEQEPLFYPDVSYWQCSDHEQGIGPEYVTISHAEIQEVVCPDLRAVLGRLSINAQIENGMYTVPIVNADGTLRQVTRTFGGTHRSAYVGS